MDDRIEEFWKGGFGDQYTDRNNDPAIVRSNSALFHEILKDVGTLQSVLELGCNRGLNLQVLSELFPAARLTGVEINQKAASIAREETSATISHTSIRDFSSTEKFDLVFTKGVLIHVDPDELEMVYRKMLALSNCYVLIVEYFNPVPVEVEYRGHGGRLFKRDFAADLMRIEPDLRLVDYGFKYRLDPSFPQDDMTWFLLKKSNSQHL